MTPKTFSRSCIHTRFRTVLAGTAVVGALAFFAAPALAQSPDNQALLDRMERLERDIRTLNQQIARQGATPDTPAPNAAGADANSNQLPTAGAPQGMQADVPDSAVARAFVRLDAMEHEVRQLTGAAESLSYRIDQVTARLDKLLVDLDYRLARLEGSQPGSFSAETQGLAGGNTPQVNAAPAPGAVSRVGAMPPVASSDVAAPNGTVAKDGIYMPGEGEQRGTLGTVSKSKIDEIVGQSSQGEGAAPAGGDGAAGASAAPDTQAASPQVEAMQNAPVQETVPAPAEQQQAAAPSVLPAGTVREQYDFAWDLIRQARFVEAEEAFKAFIAAHPDAELTENARYWLGETYYVRKRYMDAAQAFFDAYKQAPEGNKAPDSLLKLGMSMAGLDKAEEACTTFAKLRKEFTPLKANIEQALNREVQKLQCK